MYYYRHGEAIFASLLPDLPLEPAERPSAGTPSLFLIDRDPVRGRSSFCVSDPRQLTAETEDVTWLDPSRMGVPVPSLPKRLQHTIDARLLRAVNIRHPRWADFAKVPVMQLPSHLRVNLLAVGDVGSTLLTALKLLGSDCIESIGICDLNQKTVARWVTEMEQVSWPWDYDALPAVEPVAAGDLFRCDVFLFAATRGVPPVGAASGTCGWPSSAPTGRWWRTTPGRPGRRDSGDSSLCCPIRWIPCARRRTWPPTRVPTASGTGRGFGQNRSRASGWGS